MKIAYADRSEYLGDPDFVKVPVAALTSKRYAAARIKEIDADKARPARDIKPGPVAPYESDQTTHFSILDEDGNGVANTYTLNFSYGLGMVAEGTGVMLNNELDDFAAKAGIIVLASHNHQLLRETCNKWLHLEHGRVIHLSENIDDLP